jgi:hypothetical protein
MQCLDEMISEINVLAPFMEDGILCKCQGGLAVHLELDCIRLLLMVLAKQPSEPDSLSCSTDGCNILCLTRQGHHTLLV